MLLWIFAFLFNMLDSTIVASLSIFFAHSKNKANKVKISSLLCFFQRSISVDVQSVVILFSCGADKTVTRRRDNSGFSWIYYSFGCFDYDSMLLDGFFDL